ncbi:MAG: lytic transglycosylase domain-containing protein [Alphaproteobacteria bacterium]|nr:lytic transglycosylase domain-containing protein [Alphaproteobacteria bacterium]
MLAATCALRGAALTTPTVLPCRTRIAAPVAGSSSPTAPRGIPQPLDRWAPFIAEAAQRFGIPQGWIRQVIRVESGGRIMLDGRPITSPAGAVGLMQLMPQTYAQMRWRYGLGDDPFNARDNILAGTAYLRQMFDRFGDGFLAAYNAGPGRYQAYLEGRRPLPAETLSYLMTMHLPPSRGAAKPASEPFTPSTFGLFVALSVPISGAANLDMRSQKTLQQTSQAGRIFVVTAQNAARQSPSSRTSLFVVAPPAAR